ncbi:MAG: hypothetical protein Q8Q15_01945 [bacterium]|nr:hypothetical protein [bacterium]
MKKIIAAAHLATAAVLASPIGAYAADINITQPTQVKITDIGKLISAIIGFVFIIAAILFFFMLVLGGIQWMISGGDKQATEQARGRITAALIGLIIVFAAWAITKLIEQFLGIDILGKSITPPLPF